MKWRRMLGYRHIILFVVCLMYFVTYIDRTNLSLVSVFIQKDLHLSTVQMGLVFSAFAYPYALLQLPGGLLGDWMNSRVMLMVYGLVWGLATMATGAAWGFVDLFLFRVLLGLGEGGSFPTATRELVDWMLPAERGFAQGITHAFARLGGAVAPFVVLPLAASQGWRSSFYVVGACSLVWVVIWAWVGSQSRRTVGEVTSDRLKAWPTIPWRALLKRILPITAVDFCYGWSLWFYLTWMPTYLLDVRKYDLKHMSLFTAVPLIMGVVGDLVGGLISDGIARRTKSLRKARIPLLCVGFGGAIAFMLPAAFATGPVAAVVFISVAFFFLELTNSVLWAMPMDIAGPYAGTASGLMNTGFGLAGIIAPVVTGVLLQHHGSWTSVFLVKAGLLAVGIGIALTINPDQRLEINQETAEQAIPGDAA